METKTYTNYLDGFIKNMKDLQIAAFSRGEIGMSKALEYAWGMAEEFKTQGEPLEGSE